MIDHIFPSFFAPFLAFLAVVLLTLPFRKCAKIFGLLDVPDERKNHEIAVPPIGGLIVFPIFMVVGLLCGASLQQNWPLYISLVILLVTGALDDRFSLNAWVKFVAHFSAAALIVFAGEAQVAYLGNLFGMGTVWAGFMSYPFSIVAVVLLINAVNLMDGLDGLAGGISIVMYFWLIIAGFAAGNVSLLMPLILVGAVAGFLVFNMRNPWRRKASMFLGDAGSMCLGLTIAWYAIHFAHGETSPLQPIAVAWIIGLPIFDACAQFYRRVRNGQDPFAPDLGHFHHHFVNAGLTVGQSVFAIMLIVFIMGCIGFGGQWLGVPEVVLTVLWIGALFGHMALSYDTKRYVRIISGIMRTKPIKS